MYVLIKLAPKFYIIIKFPDQNSITNSHPKASAKELKLLM